MKIRATYWPRCDLLCGELSHSFRAKVTVENRRFKTKGRALLRRPAACTGFRALPKFENLVEAVSLLLLLNCVQQHRCHAAFLPHALIADVDVVTACREVVARFIPCRNVVGARNIAIERIGPGGGVGITGCIGIQRLKPGKPPPLDSNEGR